MEPNRKASQNRIEASDESSFDSSYLHLASHPQYQALKGLLSTIYSTEEEIARHNSLTPSLDKIFERVS